MSKAGTSGTLYLVATPIGHLEDITMRALKTLRNVAIIAAEDTRRTATLLRHYDITTPTRSFHQHNEHRGSRSMLQRLAGGDSVALVTDAGTPLLSDPGTKLVHDALEAGFRVQAIPGPSAILTALIASGLASSQFTFVGFPPPRSKARKLWLNNLSKEPRPLVIFEAPHRIKRCLADMLDAFGDREVAVCREMTKIHEEFVKGPISEAIERITPRGEFTLVVSADTGNSEQAACEDPSPQTIADEFGRLTENSGSKRRSMKQIAARYGLSVRSVYQKLEESKQD